MILESVLLRVSLMGHLKETFELLDLACNALVIEIGFGNAVCAVGVLVDDHSRVFAKKKTL